MLKNNETLQTIETRFISSRGTKETQRKNGRENKGRQRDAHRDDGGDSGSPMEVKGHREMLTETKGDRERHRLMKTMGDR